MKKGVFLFIFCAVVKMAFAQQPDTTVVFNKLVHDFGTIVKSDGDQTFSFEFTNKNSHPVTIRNVTSSCGCAASNWTKEPVAPGAVGYINVTYTLSGATTFNKSITVNVSGGKP